MEMELLDALGRAHEEYRRLWAQEGCHSTDVVVHAGQGRMFSDLGSGEKGVTDELQENTAGEARAEAERLRGELAKAKLELGEARLRLISPATVGVL